MAEVQCLSQSMKHKGPKNITLVWDKPQHVKIVSASSIYVILLTYLKGIVLTERALAIALSHVTMNMWIN